MRLFQIFDNSVATHIKLRHPLEVTVNVLDIIKDYII